MNKKFQLQFAHRCAILMDSGISLSESLAMIIRMERSKKRRAILLMIQEKIDKGVSLTKSVSSTKVKFEPVLISMIAHGESAGILALSLRQAGEMMEKGSDIKKKIIGALIYPGLIGCATVGMTLFLVMYIFPKIIPLFSSMNIELPLLTRAVRGLYEFILQYGLCAGIFVILSGTIFMVLYKKKVMFRYRIQLTLLVLPLAGNVLKKYFICMYCRSTATLLDCGQGLPTILGQLADSSSFYPYRKAWEFTRGEVERGISFSTSLRSFETLFPSIVSDMLSIGERTGSLSSMFHQVSRMYEEELDDFVKHLSTSIEPILMIVMGLVVGSVALSIILPIYEITNHLTTH